MSKDIKSPRDCCDYKKVESFAQSKGLEIRYAKGDHAVIRNGNEQITYCRREMGTGIGCKIFKFFLRSGLLVFIGFVLYVYLYHSRLI